MIIRNIETKEDRIEQYNEKKVKQAKNKSNGDLIRSQKEELEYLEFLEEENLRLKKLEEKKSQEEVIRLNIN